MSVKLEKDLQGIKIARVSTISFFVKTQLERQIQDIVQEGALVTVITSELENDLSSSVVEHEQILIARKFQLPSDIISLWRLYRFFSEKQFDVVHSTTPKAGFLCAVAALMASVPVRIHTFTGQPWVLRRGLAKQIFKLADYIIQRLNTICYCDSPSQLKFLVGQGIVNPRKVIALGSGSLAGVDIERFSMNRFDNAFVRAARKKLHIPEDAFVFLFLGRVVRDKGIIELLRAFGSVCRSIPKSFLLVVGPKEEELKELSYFENQDWYQNVIFVGFTDQPERYIAISDLLCLPSYREGFGTVVIECACMGVPAIGSNIDGLVDSIVDGKSGVLVEPQNSTELSSAMLKLANDEKLRSQMQKFGRLRAQNEFSADTVNQVLIKEYLSLIRKNVIYVEEKK